MEDNAEELPMAVAMQGHNQPRDADDDFGLVKQKKNLRRDCPLIDDLVVAYRGFDGLRTEHVRFSLGSTGSFLAHVFLPFVWEKDRRRIVVLSPANGGKTKLLQRIAHDWSLHGLFNELFAAVVLLPMSTLPKEASLEELVRLSLFADVNFSDGQRKTQDFLEWAFANPSAVLWLVDEVHDSANAAPALEGLRSGHDVRFEYVVVAKRPLTKVAVKCDDALSFRCFLEPYEVIKFVRSIFKVWNPSHAAITLYLCIKKTPKYAALKPHLDAICEPVLYEYVPLEPVVKHLLYLLERPLSHDLCSAFCSPHLVRSLCDATRIAMETSEAPPLTAILREMVPLMMSRCEGATPGLLHETRAKLQRMAWLRLWTNDDEHDMHVAGEMVPLAVSAGILEPSGIFSHTIWCELLAAEFICQVMPAAGAPKGLLE